MVKSRVFTSLLNVQEHDDVTAVDVEAEVVHQDGLVADKMRGARRVVVGETARRQFQTTPVSAERRRVGVEREHREHEDEQESEKSGRPTSGIKCQRHFRNRSEPRFRDQVGIAR